MVAKKGAGQMGPDLSFFSFLWNVNSVKYF